VKQNFARYLTVEPFAVHWAYRKFETVDIFTRIRRHQKLHTLNNKWVSVNVLPNYVPYIVTSRRDMGKSRHTVARDTGEGCLSDPVDLLITSFLSKFSCAN